MDARGAEHLRRARTRSGERATQEAAPRVRDLPRSPRAGGATSCRLKPAPAEYVARVGSVADRSERVSHRESEPARQALPEPAFDGAHRRSLSLPAERVLPPPRPTRDVESSPGH